MADMGTGNKILVLSQVKSVVNHAATYWYLFLTVSSTLRLRVFVDFFTSKPKFNQKGHIFGL